MTLYRKAVLIMLLTTGALAIASFVVAKTVLIPGLLAHEQHSIQERVQTLSATLDRAVVDLERTTNDYAAWDRTYQFMKRPDADYARTELNDLSFEKYDIQLVLLLGLDDSEVLRKSFRRTNGQAISAGEIAAIRAASRQFLPTIRDEVGVRGIVATPSGPYLISMRPILTSAGLGPVRGMISMARRIDQDELDYISQIVHAPVSIVPQASALPANGEVTDLAVLGGHGWFTRRPSEATARLILLDVRGKAAGALALTIDRGMVHRSERVIWFSALLVAATAVLLGLGQLWFLYTLVLSRLRSASRAVTRIGAGKDLSIRIPIRRDDELGMLARALNGMLDDLEHSRNELIELHAAAQFDAQHDALTGLKNRRAILAALEAEMSRGMREHRKLAVILADIDHFKQINDRFGHTAGDAVLKCVATVFESELRPYDNVGRYGGEEFLIIVPGVNHVRGMEVAERLRKRVEQTFALQEIAGQPVTVSLGVAITIGDSGVEDVIDEADSSMYAAKAAGRNRVEMRCPRIVPQSNAKLSEYAGA